MVKKICTMAFLYYEVCKYSVFYCKGRQLPAKGV